ncbi:MAG: GntR family transcriptional regulator [Oceanibaculum nanhaiense]|uniref:GntR family transcriptional regulator n=1 Tax=Oceanibaculum nanhaiense TaxID=1909734 RepID=UPI0025A33079|nr:GntR family transcriptional regulator [Oceanibaculum nanhaiense]MDM7945878.1 GntR family transcriptional regulator [Oceanibaculum nanhaiense]
MKPITLQPQLADRVYDAILDAICDGRLEAGQRVTQEELAASLNVSRQPVIQALMLLKRQGFLEEAGRRGLRVVPLDEAAISHVYEVRGALDGLAARAAATRNAARARTEGPALIAAGRAGAETGSVAERTAQDLAFHRFLYALSGNPLIEDAISTHMQHSRRIMGSVLRAQSRARDVWDEHEAILDAVIAGDGDRAEALARAHTARAAENLIAALKKGGQTDAA